MTQRNVQRQLDGIEAAGWIVRNVPDSAARARGKSTRYTLVIPDSVETPASLPVETPVSPVETVTSLPVETATSLPVETPVSTRRDASVQGVETPVSTEVPIEVPTEVSGRLALRNAGAREERRQPDEGPTREAPRQAPVRSRHLQPVDVEPQRAATASTAPANRARVDSGSATVGLTDSVLPNAEPGDRGNAPGHIRYYDPASGQRLQLNPERLTADQLRTWSNLIGNRDGILAQLSDADVDYLLDRYTRSTRKQTAGEFERFIAGDFDSRWWSAGCPTGWHLAELVGPLLPQKGRP